MLVIIFLGFLILIQIVTVVFWWQNYHSHYYYCITFWVLSWSLYNFHIDCIKQNDNFFFFFLKVMIIYCRFVQMLLESISHKNIIRLKNDYIGWHGFLLVRPTFGFEFSLEHIAALKFLSMSSIWSHKTWGINICSCTYGGYWIYIKKNYIHVKSYELSSFWKLYWTYYQYSTSIF